VQIKKFNKLARVLANKALNKRVWILIFFLLIL